MANTELKLEYWPIDRLVDYARNPRKNDQVVPKMVASIKEFGFKIPVLARSDGTVIDGHLRLKAARQLRLTEVPVIVADDLSETQVKAFRLLVNRSVNWADWDDDLLKLELDELEIKEFDLKLTGFDDSELTSLGIGTKPDDFGTDFSLPDGDKTRAETMTFTFSPEQSDQVRNAIARADGEKYDNYGNQNRNGNALYEIVREWEELKK